MNRVIDEIYRTQKVHDAHGNAVNIFPASIRPNEGRALHQLVRKTGAGRTLEIGLAYGLSTLFLCQAHAENQLANGGTNVDGPVHTALDPFQTDYWSNIGLLNLERADFRHMVRFYEQPSHELLPQLVRDGERFDFVFIDGAHLFDYVLLDFWYADRLVDTGGLIMLHDLVMPAVRKLLAFVLRSHKSYVIDASYHDREAPAWKRVTRSIRTFLQNPTEFHEWSLPFTQRCPDLYARNYCVLRKIGQDTRPWDHYRSF